MSDSDDFEDEAIDISSQNNVKFTSNDLVMDAPIVSQPTTSVPIKEETAMSGIQTSHASPEITKCYKDIETDENDKEAWNKFATILSEENVEEARPFFQVIMKSFPTSSRFLKMFCDTEERGRNFPAIENLLNTYLPKCLSVERYVYYCNYYENKLTYHKTGNALLEARKEVDTIYQKAIQIAGYFYDSDILWHAYKAFLDKQPRNDNDENYKNQCIDMWRSFFQKVVTIPMRNVSLFWKDFTQFELSLVSSNTNLSIEQKKEEMEKHLSVVSQQYKLASEVSIKREELWKNINVDNIAVRILTEDDIKQISLWKAAIAYEESNPMHFDADRHYTIIKSFYIRCLACCRYCPDLWMQYIYYIARDHWNDVNTAIQDAKEALPTSSLLYLSICDFYEKNDMIDEALHEYETMIGCCETSIAWIMYMQFMRRNKGIKEARNIFRRARLAMLEPELFIAAAHLEYDINHEVESALNVFRAGLTHFSENQGYILDFADFLIELNDFENARILLENSISMIANEDCSALWEKLLLLQSQYCMSSSSLSDLIKVQKAYSSANPDNRCLQGMLSNLYRYNIHNFKPTSKDDMVLLKRKNRSNLEREPGTKKLILHKKKKIIITAADTLANAETPSWMKEVLKKLPRADRGKARGSVVDSLIEALAKASLPRKNRLITKK